MKWRICTHDTHPASASEVDAMTLDEVCEALTVLDRIDEARARARRE